LKELLIPAIASLLPVVGFGQELEALEAEFNSKLQAAEKPILKEYCGKLEKLQKTQDLAPGVTLLRPDGVIPVGGTASATTSAVSSELAVARMRLQGNPAVHTQTTTDLMGVGAGIVPPPKAVGIDSGPDSPKLLLPRNAKLTGKLKLSPDERTITHWVSGSAQWEVPQLAPGVWHLIFEYGMVPCGQEDCTLTIQLGDQKKEVEIRELPTTETWSSFRATHLVAFKVDEMMDSESLILSCRNQGAPELIHLRHVLLRPNSSFQTPSDLDEAGVGSGTSEEPPSGTDL